MIKQSFFIRPRAFSAVSSANSQRYKERRDREAKMLEVSSPDLGVDLLMESDMYSSLERGNTQKGEKCLQGLWAINSQLYPFQLDPLHLKRSFKIIVLFDMNGKF